MQVVRDAELPVGEIAARFNVTRPAVSQHLKVLVDAGLVTVRSQGTRRLYKARPEGLNDVRRYLDSFWEQRLQRLKETVEAEERRTDRR